MSAKHNLRTRGNFVQRSYEAHPTVPEILNDIPVVDDFVKHKEGSAVALQRPLDGFNGHLDAGAEPAGLCQYDLFHCHRTVLSLEESGNAVNPVFLRALPSVLEPKFVEQSDHLSEGLSLER